MLNIFGPVKSKLVGVLWATNGKAEELSLALCSEMTSEVQWVICGRYVLGTYRTITTSTSVLISSSWGTQGTICGVRV